MSEKKPLEDLPIPGLVAEEPAKPAAYRRVVDWLFAPWMQDESESPEDWQSDVHRAYVAQQPLRARKILYAVAITVVCLVAWSALAKIDEVTRGSRPPADGTFLHSVVFSDGALLYCFQVGTGPLRDVSRSDVCRAIGEE